MLLRLVDRIGVRTLEGNVLTLKNRTNNTSIVLSDEGAQRWKDYIMARTYRSNSGNRSGGKRSTKSSTRITGMFPSKRKKGLYIGGAKEEQLDLLISKIKEAKQAGKGLTFFLWKNTFEDGPPFSLNVDVDASDEQRSRKRVDDEGDDLYPEDDDDNNSDQSARPGPANRKGNSFFDDE